MYLVLLVLLLCILRGLRGFVELEKLRVDGRSWTG